MTTIVPNRGLFSSAVYFFSRAPWHFLLLQTPAASIELLEYLFTPSLEKSPLVALALILPFFWLISALTASLTFLSVVDVQDGIQPTVARTITRARRGFVSLTAACTLSGLVILCGLFVILPGLYFLAVYLFVPYLAISEPQLPASAVLSYSKKLAKVSFGLTLALVLLVFLLDLGTYLTGETLGTWLAGLVAGGDFRPLVLVVFKAALGLMPGALANLIAALYFIKAKEAYFARTHSRTA